MDTERAGKILEMHGLTKKAFAEMLGVKASTARMAFSLKRFSKKMVAKLEELEDELRIEQDLAEVDEMIESVEQDTEDIESGEREAKIYGVPKNRFRRLIEFGEGSHGKFRSKPGKYLKLGESVRVKHLDRDMWEVV